MLSMTHESAEEAEYPESVQPQVNMLKTGGGEAAAVGRGKLPRTPCTLNDSDHCLLKVLSLREARKAAEHQRAAGKARGDAEGLGRRGRLMRGGRGETPRYVEDAKTRRTWKEYIKRWRCAIVLEGAEDSGARAGTMKDAEDAEGAEGVEDVEDLEERRGRHGRRGSSGTRGIRGRRVTDGQILRTLWKPLKTRKMSKTGKIVQVLKKCDGRADTQNDVEDTECAEYDEGKYNTEDAREMGMARKARNGCDARAERLNDVEDSEGEDSADDSGIQECPGSSSGPITSQELCRNHPTVLKSWEGQEVCGGRGSCREMWKARRV
eukprot:gene12172-biopygen8571